MTDEEIYKRFGKRDYSPPTESEVICVGDFAESIDHTTPENRRKRAKLEHIMEKIARSKEVMKRLDEG